ncbi:MAG: 3,4-dihydroxy-2-butanone-4-phosphate synthase [Clostridia bacterium]|nr:3,4-dihydroxy-2-butanone-4-phosphate synthase [Deltaproteobacteria bacterium]
MTFERVQRALAEIKAGRMIILVDDEDRENEGDLCMAAEYVTAAAINFMAKQARGLICMTMDAELVSRLELPLMVSENGSPYGTAFTVSIEAARGVTTGISAADRATTIKAAAAPGAKPADLVRPGHVFPLRARDGGVLVRTGQTEGSVDLAKLAGLTKAAVICEIMNDDGSMARMSDLEVFAKTHNMPFLSIAELIQYRLAHDSLVRRLITRDVEHPSWGKLTLHVYGTTLDNRQHMALVWGTLSADSSPLVRVHSGYPFASVFGNLFSDDRAALSAALETLAKDPCAVLVCIDRETPEITLEERVRNLGEPVQEQLHTAPGMMREIGIGAQILRDLGLAHIRLLSRTGKRPVGVDGFGLVVDDVVTFDTVGKTTRPVLEVVRG